MNVPRAFAVWLLLAIVEFIHGALRTLFLAPRIGDFPSRQVGVLTGSLLILLVVYLISPWLEARSGSAQFRVGLLWVLLTFAFELALGRALGRPWSEIFLDFNPDRGGFLVFGFIVLALSPWIAANFRGTRE